MKILVANELKGFYNKVNKKKMKEVLGLWLEVDTRVLFPDQFYTPITLVVGGNLRIMEIDVIKIEEDMRLYRKYCSKCLHHSAIADKKCSYCGCTNKFHSFFAKQIKEIKNGSSISCM